MIVFWFIVQALIEVFQMCVSGEGTCNLAEWASDFWNWLDVIRLGL